MINPGQVNLGEIKVADEEWDCDADVVIRDLVSVLANDHVRRTDASDESKMSGVGFVTLKLTTTTCLVRSIGKIETFAGLEAGKTYFADPAVLGGITKDGPIGDSGKVLQKVGVAKSNTTLIIGIDRDYTIL